ncbi:hypothetical protein DOLIC_00014 [Dolichomitus sp. PSUC_FEM 10030005]|nr:hypothetical protein [Dolichomitus sp. PSUC_FEM 10030005]
MQETVGDSNSTPYKVHHEIALVIVFVVLICLIIFIYCEYIMFKVNINQTSRKKKSVRFSPDAPQVEYADDIDCRNWDPIDQIRERHNIARAQEIQ